MPRSMASKRINKGESELVTVGKMAVMFEGLKDLIKSTAKATETTLGKRIDSVEQTLGKRIDFVELALRATKDELTQEIKKVDKKVDVLDKKVDVLDKKTDNLAADLRTEMKSMETRLSDKIDSIHTHIDEHEAKPLDIAHPPRHL